MIYTGAFLFDHPKSGQVAGWGAVAGQPARRYESLSGALTSPDIIWWTNADNEVLTQLAMPARFLPENTFGAHMASFLEAWGVPLLALSNAEMRERGFSRNFTLAGDPEMAAALAALIAARIPEWTKVPLACGHYIKQVLPAARSAPAPSVTRALRRLVNDESEYFSRTAERSSPSRTFRAFSLSPMQAARNLTQIPSETGDGLVLAYPAGSWRSVKSAPHRTVQDLLEAARPLLAYARVEMPDSALASLLVLGSGTKSKTREWFAVPELSLLAGIGAKVTVGGSRGRGTLLWEAERRQEVAPPPSGLLHDGSWSAGAAALALLTAMGRDQRGQITPTQLWLRGIDMTHTLLAAMRLSRAIGEALPDTRPRLFGHYLGSAWLMLDNLMESDEPVLQAAALREGFLVRGAPVHPGLSDIDSGAPLAARWLAASREAGPVVASLIDGLGLVATPEQAQAIESIASRGSVLASVTATAAAYVFADGSDWTAAITPWKNRRDDPAAVAALIQSAQALAATLPPAARQSLVKTVGSLAQAGRPIGLIREAVTRLSRAKGQPPVAKTQQQGDAA